MVHETSAQSTQYKDISDKSLIALYRAGDHDAFNALTERYHTSYIRVARSVVGEDDAADVVQDAWMNMVRKIHTFNGEGSFKGWSYRIVVNCGRMLLRKRSRRREVNGESFEQEIPENAWPESRVYQKELGEIIQSAIETLAPSYAEIIDLREKQGLSMNEMAERLGITTGGVKTRLHRARGFLRTAIEAELA